MIECVCKQKNHIATPRYFVFIILKSCLPPERKGGSPNKYAVVSAYKIFLKRLRGGEKSKHNMIKSKIIEKEGEINICFLLL